MTHFVTQTTAVGLSVALRQACVAKNQAFSFTHDVCFELIEIAAAFRFCLLSCIAMYCAAAVLRIFRGSSANCPCSE